MYIVYILQSQIDCSFYIGFTNNIGRRLEQHNNGESNYTSNKLPWKIVYCESLETKSEALTREKFLKRQKNVKFYNKLIRSGSSAG